MFVLIIWKAKAAYSFVMNFISNAAFNSYPLICLGSNAATPTKFLSLEVPSYHEAVPVSKNDITVMYILLTLQLIIYHPDCAGWHRGNSFHLRTLVIGFLFTRLIITDCQSAYFFKSLQRLKKLIQHSYLLQNYLACCNDWFICLL